MARVFLLHLLFFVLTAVVYVNGKGTGQPPFFHCGPDGHFADYYRSCVVYYKCVGGQKTRLFCLGDEVFDETKGVCSPKHRVSCPYPDK